MPTIKNGLVQVDSDYDYKCKEKFQNLFSRLK